MNIIRPMEPIAPGGRPMPGWRKNIIQRFPGNPYPQHVWDHEYGVRAITAMEVVEEAGHPESSGPHYHVSLTRWVLTGPVVKGPLRIDSADAAYVLREFFGGLDGWEEDNHLPDGKARHFWRPVDETKVGMECFCKKHEPRITEDGGDYVWRPL